MSKKLFGALVIGLAFALSVMPQTASAAAGTETHVSGYVREKGFPVEGAKVFVSCDSQGAYAQPTDAYGYYTITLDNPPCSPLSDIKVIAFGPTSKGDVITRRHGPENKIDVALGVIVPIPEYGWIGGALAAGGWSGHDRGRSPTACTAWSL